MKKLLLILVVLMIASFSSVIYAADDGYVKQVNAELIEMEKAYEKRTGKKICGKVRLCGKFHPQEHHVRIEPHPTDNIVVIFVVK